MFARLSAISIDFAGAVEWLADRYAVTLEYEETARDE